MTTIRQRRNDFAHFSAHPQMARHVVIVHPYCQTLMPRQHMASHTTRKCSSSQMPGTPTATSQDGKSVRSIARRCIANFHRVQASP